MSAVAHCLIPPKRWRAVSACRWWLFHHRRHLRAWTPLSVWYNDAGQALQFEVFDDANFLVLVEPHIILKAPAEYLLAGIGDTLAKWYEAVVLAPEPENLPLTVRLGINGALAIRDVLLSRSEEALADQQRGEATQAFRDVVDAIIAGGGMVGGLGERYTRVAAAHAVHNGLTVLPQTEKYLHGTKVAYGILVQSALLGQDDVLAELVAAYQRFTLPTTLRELEVDINNRDGLDKVIAHTLRPVESIHYLPVALTLRFCAPRLRKWNPSAVNRSDRLYLMMILITLATRSSCRSI